MAVTAARYWSQPIFLAGNVSPHFLCQLLITSTLVLPTEACRAVKVLV